MTLWFIEILSVVFVCLVAFFALVSVAVDSFQSKILTPLDAEWEAFERARLSLAAQVKKSQ